jgi:thiamine pyrophosphokinase
MKPQTPFALIIIGGDAPQGLALQALLDLWPLADLKIAADSGAEHLLALDLLPDLVVGDGDSLSAVSQAALKQAGVPFASLPVHKDLTDGEAAYQSVFAAGYSNLAIFGADGGRSDHWLGNLLLPLNCSEQWQQIIFYLNKSYAWYCFGEAEIKGQPGDTVSLIALSDQVDDINLEGFYYPLKNATTKRGSSLCLSNQLQKPTAYVRFATGGIMLVVHTPI